jgi:hypothetical protein
MNCFHVEFFFLLYIASLLQLPPLHISHPHPTLTPFPFSSSWVNLSSCDVFVPSLFTSCYAMLSWYPESPAFWGVVCLFVCLFLLE